MLSADSFTEINVPFEPNNTWIRLTPNLEILVEEARCVGNSMNYRIKTNSPRRTPGSFGSPRLEVGEPLPSHMIVTQEFLDSKGQAIGSHRFGSLPIHVGGNGSGSGGNHGDIETIRYRIAVDPVEYKIPFELEDIPLPNP